jgi:hypothetical protein
VIVVRCHRRTADMRGIKRGAMPPFAC